MYMCRSDPKTILKTLNTELQNRPPPSSQTGTHTEQTSTGSAKALKTELTLESHPTEGESKLASPN